MEFDRRGPPAAALQTALSHRLTLVVAAAGWGKSTLLRGLVAAAPSIEVRRSASGWNAFTLARAMVDGIAEKTDRTVADTLPAYPISDSPDRGDQIAALATSVCSTAAEALTDDTLVVLDDVDIADGDPLGLFLETLILGLPPRLHLVLACRAQPSLRIARLRAAGEVARISADDLAVSVADVDSLELDPAATAAVTDIVTATGGWPLAVHLAAEAARRGEPLDQTQLVEHLLAPNTVLFDYLAEDVLSGLGDGERELLVLAAHVPELSDRLLRGIGRADLSGPLAHLSAERIFLEPVPGRAGHARASLVGRAFVRRALPPPPPEVLAAAVSSLVRSGDVENALVLSAAVGDPQLARDVLMAIRSPDTLGATEAMDDALRVAESGGGDPRLAELRGDLAYQRGSWDEALRHYDGAAEQLDKSSTVLSRKRAGLLYLRGRLDDAEAVCAQVPLDDHDDPAEVARVLAWRAVICWARGDGAGCERFVIPAFELAEPCGDDGALAAVYTARAMLAALRGDLRANALFYDKALRHAERAGDVAQIVRIRTNRGSRFTEQGQYAKALAELDEAITIAELAGSDTFAALAYTNRGEVHVATGHLDLALADLRRGHQIWSRLGSERILYALNSMGTVQILRGQRSEALALFNEAVSIASDQRDAQGLVPACVGLAKALELDDPAGAAAAARRAIEANHAMWMPHAYTAAGTVALQSGDHDAAARWAAKATELAHERHDRPALAEALLLRAASEQPPSAKVAAEASRLWHDLGNPIGEARADLLIAQTSPAKRRDELVARAERVLQDAGAWGVLAEARRESGRDATSPVSIATLGGFRVSRGGEPVDVSAWGSRKARDLVKLLVARRGAPVVRDEATALLWPDEPDRSARRLSVLLSTVRTVFDPAKEKPAEHFVAADHDTMWLVRDHVDIDVERFLADAAEGRRMLASGDADKASALLARAAAHYLGEFFADDPYADWAAGLRALAKHTFVDTCFELAKLADGNQEFSEAIRYWLRILDVDPYDEDAHLGMIRSLRAQRRHGEARRAYRAYCTRMAELDLEPTPFPS
jgi:ATP/maltotriose-dependent transcriptional regulator MalT/DNA-binding SARP family transcriptional activator